MRKIALELQSDDVARPGWRYYVTIRRDSQVGFLLGPFDSFDDAKARQADAVEAAIKAEPFAVFDRFGVSRVESQAPALLNDQMIGEES